MCWNGKEQIAASALWSLFLSCAFSEVHGFSAKTLKEDALALVELGLARAETLNEKWKVAKFEPLVLETVRRAFLDTEDSVSQLLRDMGNNRGSQGSLLEFVLPRLAFFGPESRALFDYAVLDKRPVAALRKMTDSPLTCFEAVWRWGPSRFGKIAVSEQESAISLMQWFHGHVVDRDAVLPMGFYPGITAGPDYVALVQRWETVGNVLRLSDSGVLPRWALVVVQAKVGEGAVSQDAEAALDLSRFYRNQFGHVIQDRHVADYARFLVELRDMPVIRVVVSGRSELGTSCRAVLHGRPESRFSWDLVLVVSGKQHLDVAFGEGAGDFLGDFGVAEGHRL